MASCYFVDDVVAPALQDGRMTFIVSPEVTGPVAISTVIAMLKPGQGHVRQNHPEA